MAKEEVTVCLPPCDKGEAHEAISAVMAPYDYNREDVPDDPEWTGEWDYWRIDGRRWGQNSLPEPSQVNCTAT
ncbi:hypothetical protein OOK36_40430 [Streptomyces sp. NBC_00365]|uniref:hypothetical protein n=1 Tax=Streptomyces sp. NBC_00365 TaxID=2975726 RepID=UPI00225B897E|nr:hypothetical protein [Streptomyces sp. NBC_00365]MCX5095014.1 hypothetical protein [Streptomyces sp. NBC_00365]